jgi:hypothetical protein
MNIKPTTPLTRAGFAVLAGALALPFLAGCGGGPKEHAPPAVAAKGHDHPDAPAAAATQGNDDADIRAERAKLSPEDQALVAAQEYCAISTEERLGAMGPPVKIMLNDQPVFLCCKGCEKRARANPDQTLATVAELKAKVKAGAAK